MDSLSRIRSRAKQRQLGHYGRLIHRPGICSSELTSIAPFSVGSAIGQVPQGQQASTNLLKNTAGPITGAGGNWTANGGATITQDVTRKFDAGFFPTVIHGALTTDNVSNNSVVPVVGTAYTVSAYFSVAPSMGLANNSPQVRFTITFNGNGIESGITFSPANGGILSVSAAVTSAHSTQDVVTLPNGTTAVLYRMDFTVTAPAASTTGTLRIYARSDANGNGDVMAGGFQVEPTTSPTAFIPTASLEGTRQRTVGALPQQMTRQFITPVHLNADYVYQPGVDNGCAFVFDTTNKTFTLANITGTNDGEWCIVQNSNAGFTAISTVGSGGILIFGPGLPVAGVTGVNLPLAGTGAQTPNACIMARWDATLNGWVLSDLSSAGVAGTQPPITVTNAMTPYGILDTSVRAMRTFLVDTSGGAVTMNFPVNPIDGEIINVKRTTTDGTQLGMAYVAKNIEGAAASFLDQNPALSSYSFQYDAASNGWWAIGQ